MLTQVMTPQYGFNFLKIAKEYAEQKSPVNKIDLVVKIIFFSVTAAEVIANQEAMNYLSGDNLARFVRYAPPKKHKEEIEPEIYRKWRYLYQKNNIDTSEVRHLDLLKEAIFMRNEFMHFKPHENQTKKILISKKQGVLIDGELFQVFRKTGYKIEKDGIINKVTLSDARDCFKNIDNLIFKYFETRLTWPYPKFCNDQWGKRSPFWTNRTQINKWHPLLSNGQLRFIFVSSRFLPTSPLVRHKS